MPRFDTHGKTIVNHTVCVTLAVTVMVWEP